MQLSLVVFCAIFGFVTVFQMTEQKVMKREENEGLESHSITRRGASDLLFPEEEKLSPSKLTLRRDVSNQELEPSPCPNGAAFCEAATDYPKQHVQTLLKKQPKFVLNQFFVEMDAVITDRFNEIEEKSLCPSEPNTIYPNKGQARDGTLEFIVNEDNYKQGIKVEKCLNDGGKCEIPGSLSLSYSAHCRQKNIVRTLVVVNRNMSDAEGFITKPFEFPSCCACMITMNNERFGDFDPLPTSPAIKSNSTKTVKG